jgi:hypothetical protein
MPITEKNIQALNARYAWPRARPEFNPAEWSLDGGGRKLIINRIRQNEPFLIIEIGVFLGGSVKQWLETSDNVYVIAIDPWEGEWWANYARKNGRNALAEQFSRESGPYLTFLSSLWEFKDRLFPVRGASPGKLYELAELSIKPDMVYFDSNKTGEDIEVAHQLFPDAILAGDDWTWGREEGYPIRAPVKAFANKDNYRVVSDRATWVLVQGSLRISEKIHNIISIARDCCRSVRKFFT